MGVDLGDLAVGKSVPLEQLSGKKFAVDAFNNIYQFLSSIRQPDGTPLMDSKGRVTSHLTGLFYRNTNLLERGIKPIYVFDGKPPEFKRRTVAERSAIKEEATDRWKAALASGNMEDARKFASATSRFTAEMIEESKQLLSAMGIPVIQAPSEGEAQASQIVAEREAYAVASQDFDCLLFGAPLLLRNLNITGKRKVPRKNITIDIEPELISLPDVLSNNDLNRSQLIWMGILSGTDFNSGIKGIGPKKALKIAWACKDINQVVEYCRNQLKYEFEEDPAEVEKFFLHPPVEHGIKPKFGTVSKEKIIKLLCDEHDFSSERVGKTVDALSKKMNEKGEQTGLSQWA